MVGHQNLCVDNEARSQVRIIQISMRWKSQVQPSAKSNSICESSDCCSQVGFDGHLQPGAFLAYLSLVIAPSPIVQHYKCIGIVLSGFADTAAQLVQNLTPIHFYRSASAEEEKGRKMAKKEAHLLEF